LSLPHAEEHDHFGSPSFRVGGKNFAQLSTARLGQAVDRGPGGMDHVFSGNVFIGAVLGTPRIDLCATRKRRCIDASMLHDLFWQSWRQVATKKYLVDHESRRR
jgi:hypothetical protein